MTVFARLRRDIDGMIARDPAAQTALEVVLCYPAFHALLHYRLSHWLWTRRWRLLARMVSQFARWITGIEIHPGARIGHGFFVDHGMGVVIGETAEIGNNVTLYHDVTLGGVSPAEDSDSQRSVKRHPTLEDGVIVGSGAQILGPITVGRNARIGANAVVVKDVPEGVTVVGIPAKVVTGQSRAAEPEFSPYGTPIGDIPDPVAQTLQGLLSELTALQTRVKQLEQVQKDHATGGRGHDDESAAPFDKALDDPEKKRAGFHRT